MALKQDVQYIRYYTDGSAAVQPEYTQPKRGSSLPKKRRKKVHVVVIDPTAITALVVAVVMLGMMLSALSRLQAARQEQQVMRGYVQQLDNQKQELLATYEQTVDLTVVEERALALGLVPVEQVQHITIQVPRPVEEPVVEQEVTLWEKICIFFAGVFA